MMNPPDNVTEVFNDGTQAYYKVKVDFSDLIAQWENSMNKEQLNELANKAGLGHYMIVKEFPEMLERFAKLVSDPLEAKIDELMLEYCPDEMTEEQYENWAKHQVPTDKEKTND